MTAALASVFARWFSNMSTAITFAEEILKDNAPYCVPLIQLYRIGNRVLATVRT